MPCVVEPHVALEPCNLIRHAGDVVQLNINYKADLAVASLPPLLHQWSNAIPNKTNKVTNFDFIHLEPPQPMA
jgi:hypothetical protein